MKNDLIILRYKTENVIGTKTTLEPKTYFGSKMIDIEDVINIDNSEIQYSDVVSKNNNKINGYQYLNYNVLESIKLICLDDIKNKYNNINIINNISVDSESNTQWRIIIQWKKILSDYLFAKLKEARTFKCIRYNEVLSENLNFFIYDYIKENLLNRYDISNIDFYIKYFPIDEGDEETTEPNLIYNPKFNPEIYTSENYIKNLNSKILTDYIIINYKQTKNSKQYKFDYYFNISMKKI